MIKWFRKASASSGLVAVCPGGQGIAVAAVTRGAGVAPQLDWAGYVSAPRADSGRAAGLHRLLAAHDAHRCAGTSVLPSGDYHLVLLEAPDVPAEELREAVRWRVKDLIDFNVGEAVIDVFRTPPMKGGRNNMVYAVVARESAVRRVIDEVEGAEQALGWVDIPEFALRNVTAQLAEDVAGVACLHLEGDSGLIVITRQGELYLSRRFEGSVARLLTSAGGGVTAENEGLLDAIVIEIQRSLDYYESQFSQPPVRNLVVAPLEQSFDGLEAYLGSQLGIAARRLALSGLIECAQPLDDATSARCLIAVGAALRDLEAAA
ncbi:MAG: type IV pilus biogenesis protein PilM [Gammaproteobacteria bacterium]